MGNIGKWSMALFKALSGYTWGSLFWTLPQGSASLTHKQHLFSCWHSSLRNIGVVFFFTFDLIHGKWTAWDVNKVGRCALYTPSVSTGNFFSPALELINFVKTVCWRGKVDKRGGGEGFPCVSVLGEHHSFWCWKCILWFLIRITTFTMI